MKKLVIESKFMKQEQIFKLHSYLQGICAGEIAVAEPSMDSDLDWQEAALVMAMSEAYFAHKHENSALVIGFICKNCRRLEIDVVVSDTMTKKHHRYLEVVSRFHQDHVHTAICLEV